MTVDCDVPTEYATPGLRPTVPGADWFINGKRFSETGRTVTADGMERIHLHASSPVWP